MTVIGDSDLWSDTFPDRFVPDVLTLVCETWERFEKPAADADEVEITRLFRRDLKRAKDLKGLPLRVKREEVEDDFATGREVGRKDIVFEPTHRAREEIYFCFECKRLNVLEAGKPCRPYAADYVTKGMVRFVTGQYASGVREGGMIGYVLDGRLDHAKKTVEKNIRKKCSELRMQPPGVVHASRFLKDKPSVGETEHDLGRGRFVIHHLFLNCPRQGKPSKGDPEPTA